MDTETVRTQRVSFNVAFQRPDPLMIADDLEDNRCRRMIGGTNDNQEQKPSTRIGIVAVVQ